ncbi:uncharacterized protein LY89DRAFT_789356 [Mollisia scopiformis]|uniref:Uncharacterized protein n=1 Tax=Mollisia scopiformis TaxID=149040 RepID=A0A132B6U2_MOLSC|nr:uncharacterized protein LY89DRAFT_789356 [Mollisia scopiformis]KUJ08125.1 hypothetical protein LY89DRAFT_789356 [Mollisia scopiformis]
MSADKAPAEKLPLATRKNVRDGWEAKKGDLETQMEALVGVKWTFTCNSLAIYPYAEPNSYGFNSLGDCIFAYFDGLIWSLKSFVEKHGPSGVAELNSVCPTHTCTLLASTKFSYCGSMVADGQLQLVFNPKQLGSNVSYVAQDLDKALSEAPQPAGASPLSYAARHSVKTDYDTKIADMTEKVKKILKNENFKFEPEFDDLGKALKGGKGVRDDWETNLGSFAKGYYDSFIDVLEREKFAEDELLREGLEEGAPAGVVKLRVVEKLAGGSGANGYNEILIEDGKLVIQTTPANWGTNISYACEKLVDIL